MTLRMRQWLPLVLVIVAVLGVMAWASGWFALSATDATAGSTTATSAEDQSAARSRLAELTVKASGSMAGYSRDRFPHWSTVEGTCDTREMVLKRDGKDVRGDAECRAVSGSWTSPYDGATWTKATDVDIDHWVPLAAAWRSGASEWTDEHRKEFANDLTRRQLIAVTDNVNQAKGDKSPDEWKPLLTGYWCTYSINWIEVKHYYKLSITGAEKTALLDMLSYC